MGLFKPHGRHGGRHGPAVIRPVVIHGLKDALAVAAAARSLGLAADLITEPGASAHIGPAMFAALVTQIRKAAPEIGEILYDCGTRRGDVLAGLHAGLKQFCMDGEAIVPALIDLAGRQGATIIERPVECGQFDSHDPGGCLRDR